MRFFILICFLLLIKKILLANASPYEESFLYKTGNILAIPKKHIQVLDEKLLIKIIDDDHCKVEVDYTFYNNHKSEKVDIAFPVDYIMTDQHSVTNYSISVNNQIISYSSKKTEGDSVIYEEPQPFRPVYDQYKTKTSKIHFLSSINFIQKRETVVHIEYIVKNDFLDWESSKSLFPTFSLRKFRYDLSPARF